MSGRADAIEVLIEKLVHGGSGLARLDTGQAVFVPGVLPGERVVVNNIVDAGGDLGQGSDHRAASILDPDLRQIGITRAGECRDPHPGIAELLSRLR